MGSGGAIETGLLVNIVGGVSQTLPDADAEALTLSAFEEYMLPAIRNELNARYPIAEIQMVAMAMVVDSLSKFLTPEGAVILQSALDSMNADCNITNTVN